MVVWLWLIRLGQDEAEGAGAGGCVVAPQGALVASGR